MRLIEATCVDMFIDCDLVRKEIIINKQNNNTEQKDYSILSLQESVAVTPQEALLSELQEFISSIFREGKFKAPNSYEALDAMRICDIVQKSILNN